MKQAVGLQLGRARFFRGVARATPRAGMSQAVGLKAKETGLTGFQHQN
jgi:hypothetical protein